MQFDKLQSLYIEEVLRLQAEQRKYQDAKVPPEFLTSLDLACV
jgi:DNA-directed RNA polymerase